VGQGPLGQWEEKEAHVPTTILANLGCDWPDAPVARFQVTPVHAPYWGAITIYLPATHDPVFIRRHHEGVAYLKSIATSSFGEVTGFERPWNDEMFLELVEELEAENNEE
jgi:diadenosine tetraphosphatase ApaH/serine/threonine PP2A family protein phosphatase